jgi:signal transduction histidine kinase
VRYHFLIREGGTMLRHVLQFATQKLDRQKPTNPQTSQEATRKNLMAALVHNMREPVDTIAGYAELLLATQDETISASTRRNYHEALLASARRLQEFHHDFQEVLNFEKPIILTELRFDLAEALEAVVEGLREQAEHKRVSIILQVIEDVEVVGDLARLRRLLRQLMADAVNMARAGDCVKVDLTRAAQGGAGVSIQGAEFWRPEISWARKVLGLHGGSVAFDAGGVKLGLELPGTRLHWPQGRQR